MGNISNLKISMVSVCKVMNFVLKTTVTTSCCPMVRILSVFCHYLAQIFDSHYHLAL